MSESLKKREILRFWRDVEIFDLPSFNDDAALLNNGEALPWLEQTRSPRKNYKWRYTIIFGRIEKKLILNELNALLKVDQTNDWEEPVRGFSCIGALILDEQGRPEEDSYVMASYTFGINALHNNEALGSVSNALEKARESFFERYNIIATTLKGKQASKGNIVYWEQLNKELDYLKKLFNWLQEDIKIYILAEEVPKDSEPNSGFLNSFYLDDLNYISGLEDKNLGMALQGYLNLRPSVDQRKDIIQNKQLLFQTLNPGLMTAGRWPSKVEHGLYAAQMGAVNTIFSNLRNNEGLQGINGPPGTGKTTLLLDVISEIIVERAKVISNLGCDMIFQGGYTKIVKENGFEQYTYSLDKRLQGDFGIVVASNNNAAVENISKELPLKSKIDLAVFPDADYFSMCAKTLIEQESWGVLAAALGNAKNRSNFRKAFWKPDQDVIGFNDLLHNVYKDSANDEVPIHRESFESHQKLFKSLLDDFERFKKLASSFHEQLPLFIKNKKEEPRINNELKKVTDSLPLLAAKKVIILDRRSDIQRDAERLQSQLYLHSQRKPSFFFFQKLFKTSSFKKWNLEAEAIFTSLKSIDSQLEELKRELEKNDKDTQALLVKEKEYKATLAALTTFFTKYKKLQNTLSQDYDIEVKNLFNIDFFEKELDTIHLLNPYHSPKVAKLRSDIFITALQLHRDAILVNAKKIRNNLAAYFEMSAGWIKVDATLAQNLWDTFFLCVPVVSTTMASASRLFPNANKQQIGWLLIDEAGQATPQSAAGLIHRAKRCVVVGDPLQVEPVVTIPEKLVTKLRNEHAVEVNWSPYSVSVQQLADRVSLSGTYMKVGDLEQKIWTGFPLRTHRRCDEPMFSIANKIAYSNQMVKAVNTNATEIFIGESCWFDINIPPTLINKHVVKEEIEFLIDMIFKLNSTGYKSDIYVISPFKSIASYCNEQLRNNKKVSCGTIHKFQGKEADIVFLVLGSDPKSSGARSWASQKPNMLNVAVTRAKKRFYVIGNKGLWGACDYFSTMAKGLK